MDFDTSGFLTAFGVNLRDARNSARISQEELASLAGLDRTYISLLERGKRNPSLVCIGKLAQALKIPISDVFAAKKGSSQ